MKMCLIREVVKKMKAYMAMVFLQIGYAGMFVISMISLKQGMSHYVLVVYRNAVAALVMAPFALWFERKMRPRMTMSCFLKILLLALLEPVLDQNFFYMGNKATSANYAAALYNVLPAMTFIIAVILRMEKININSKHSQAKIIGTLVTVLGALVMILYKGNIIDFPWTRGQHGHNTTTTSDGRAITQNSSHWLAGTFMLLWSCLCWSGFFILQAHTLKSYPAELSLTTLICLFGMFESGAVALVMEKGTKPWALAWDTSLFTPLYSGVMCSGVAYYVQGIVMKERGPVFVTAFNPLCMVIVAILASIILAEDITVGRVIGAVIIVMGLYLLIWGKGKDKMEQSVEIIDEKEGTMELEKNANKGGKANDLDYVTIVEIPPSKTI
ncbi:WAT1-related protein [Dioscorea alata]|uniref:WAT1-related protein n=1 Tax=Dioscorea alata TaxID=55571 RepID=A0ACB7VXQ2_DIOAL|nr:WAT1-related protein [Dioscorea alata]